MISERQTDAHFDAVLAEMRADFRAATNNIIRWNVASLIVATVATFLIVR